MSDFVRDGGVADAYPLPGTQVACIGATSFWPLLHIVESAWLEHGPFALWVTDAVRPRILVELGTHNGFSYLSFCQARKWLGLATACYAVDTWLGDDHAGLYGEEIYAQVNALNDRNYAGFSRLLRCRFDEALPYFADGSIDLLHIDGRHAYDDVKVDFESWKPKLSSRAIVLFHDTNVRESDFGVWRFWAELSGQYPSFEFLHGHGLGVLAFGPDVPVGLRPLFGAETDQRSAIQAVYSRLGRAVSREFSLDQAARNLGAVKTAINRLSAERQNALTENANLHAQLNDKHQALQALRQAFDEQTKVAEELRAALASHTKAERVA